MRALSTLLILAISLTLFAPVASLVGAEDPAKGFSGITTIGGGGTTLASPGRTYRLEWQDPVTGLTNYAPIKPVLGWPAGHPLTQNRMCGEGPFAAGEAIPSEGLWSKKGSEENSGFKPKCKRATSGQLFYAYGFPTGSSSNAHEGNKNAINIYLLIDDADEAFFVAVVDQPDNYQPDLPRPRMASLEVQITGDMKGLVPELVLGVRECPLPPCSLFPPSPHHPLKHA